jgi:DNA-binding CsgD family transcriptional regulator
METNQWEQLQIKLKNTEKEVLKLAAMGFDLEETAKIMIKSFNTIRTYRKNIFKKLNVNNISEAIVYAKNYRLI